MRFAHCCVAGAGAPRPIGRDRHLELLHSSPEEALTCVVDGAEGAHFEGSHTCTPFALQVQVCRRWTRALCRRSACAATSGSPACWGARARPLRATGRPPAAPRGVRRIVFRTRHEGPRCASRVDPMGRLRTAVQERAGGCGAPYRVRMIAADDAEAAGALLDGFAMLAAGAGTQAKRHFSSASRSRPVFMGSVSGCGCACE